MGAAALWAHDPITTKITYSREIVRLFHKRCLGCHKEGGRGPMSLATYAEARPWAKAIKEEVLERRMPPWGAVKGFGEFANDQALTQEEISIIADWVEGGAPEGEPKFLPEKPLPGPPSSPHPQGSRILIRGSHSLAAAARLTALTPQTQSPIESARIVAELPDGSTEPLLWLRQYNAEWRRTFQLREPVALPAGTRIRIEGAAGLGIAAHLAPPGPR